MRGLWRWFWRPAGTAKWGVVFLSGAVISLVALASLDTAMEYSSNMEFCTSCHEMADTVFDEYKQTVHYKNRSGVRASCTNCHIHESFMSKLLLKVRSANQLYHKVIGTVDTPEKFDAHRMEMARGVWKRMVENDSRECRSCHSFDAMHWEEQGKRAKGQMKKAQRKHMTCIECHHGIAHDLPEYYDFKAELKKAGIAVDEL